MEVSFKRSKPEVNRKHGVYYPQQLNFSNTKHKWKQRLIERSNAALTTHTTVTNEIYKPASTMTKIYK